MSLRDVLQGRRVVIVRHGNTNKADIDAERELTDKGRDQCVKFRTAWPDELQGMSNVLASVAKRTMQTAELLVGPERGVMGLEDLYFVQPWRTDAMKAADRDLGYAPIRAYIEKHPGSHDIAREKMAAAVAEAGPSMKPGDVLIVNHAAYMSFLALEVLDALAPDSAWLESAQKTVLDTNVGEVCGFEISVAKGCRYLPNPESTDFEAAKSNDAFVTSGES
eukprot:TRINITY_DN29554_c0_g1_i1.p1 TRINITY_DN29554_c0_g1~~TRINITY_DN29554_c0_g1_i1.p1  ORF type:complete len:221 (+),score=42.52 TRINITY_DN29554_c0_g1_i1:75-737(+)